MTIKTYLPIAASIVMLAACSNKNCDKNNCTAQDAACQESAACANGQPVTYTGVLPAADADGIEYILVLDYDDAKSGDYVLTEKSMSQDESVFTSKGDFTLHTGTPASASQSYIKLTPDHSDRASDLNSASAEVRYFLIDSDSTLTLTGADLQPAASGLNYTLTRR